ncbi:Ger(x)C family spore germination protein [Desulfofalx alkaliphila]|uniref:Ger(x)C family spore germination protein n=1 Tax=Desulfofalx alkaliphila TaxID=105483 RepID=UPI0004E19DFE|nr:Ger(x)C family spore germination protein [Desulfofalx alkaliphila]
MNKPLLWLTAMLLLVSLICGCWSRKEIETLAISSAIGVDKVTVKGQDLWLFSSIIVQPEEINIQNESQAGSGNPDWLVSAHGETIYDAASNISLRSPREVFRAHANILVLGERVAKEGVEEVIDFFLRDPSSRLRSWVLVTEGQAIDVLKAEPQLNKLLAEEFTGMVSVTQKTVSKSYVISHKDFINHLLTPGRDAAASRVTIFKPPENVPPPGFETYSDEGDVHIETKLTGASVFKKDRLVGWLGERETQGFLFVINEADRGAIPVGIHRQAKDVSFLLNSSTSKIIPDIQGDNITITVDLVVEGDLAEHDEARYHLTPEMIYDIEQNLAQEIKDMVEGVIYTCQHKYGADIFGFGESLRKKYPRYWKGIEEQWRDIYPQVNIVVNVEADIRRTGMVANAPEIK